MGPTGATGVRGITGKTRWLMFVKLISMRVCVERKGNTVCVSGIDFSVQQVAMTGYNTQLSQTILLASL